MDKIFQIILSRRKKKKYITGINVWLKSGGPKMTIGHIGYGTKAVINGNYVICYWEVFTPFRGYSSGIFRKETLTFIEPVKK